MSSSSISLASYFTPPLLPLGLLEIYIDNKEMWDNIRDRGKGEERQTVHLIPICALAPTVPRTLVPGAGWKPYPVQAKPIISDGAGLGSGSFVD